MASAQRVEQFHKADGLADVCEDGAGVVAVLLDELAEGAAGDAEVLEQVRLSRPSRDLGLVVLVVLVLVVVLCGVEVLRAVDVGSRSEQRTVGRDAGGSQVGDEEARLLVAVHPDQREPLVLVLDDGEDGLVADRHRPKRVRQLLQGRGVIDLNVTRAPCGAGAGDDSGEVGHGPSWHREEPRCEPLRNPRPGAADDRLRPCASTSLIIRSWPTS